MTNKIWNWATALVLGSVSTLAPLKTVMLTILVLLVIDLLTGIWAAKKRGEPIHSAGLRRTISKFLSYMAAVIAAFLVEKNLIAETIKLSELVGGAIGIVELKSILENANTISGKDLFKEVIGKLGSSNDKPPTS